MTDIEFDVVWRDWIHKAWPKLQPFAMDILREDVQRCDQAAFLQAAKDAIRDAGHHTRVNLGRLAKLTYKKQAELKAERTAAERGGTPGSEPVPDAIWRL